jgi:tetratricopeptide (TPR) repeat protein
MYDDPSEVYELAIAAAERALSIDPRQTAALVVLGHVDRLWRWDSVAAAKRYREALDINPLDVETLIAIDVLYAQSGLPGPAIFEKVFELDPLNPRPIINHALNLWNAGDFDGGREALDKARPISPDAVRLVGIESMFDYGEGNYESVIRSGRDDAPISYACALRALGRTAEADAELQRAQDSNSDILVMAALHSCWGDLDAAFDALERAYEEHNHRLRGIRQNLYFRPLHDDERWANLLERVGLSDDVARRVQGVFADVIPAS